MADDPDDEDPQIEDIEQLLDKICEARPEGETVSVDAIMDMVGRRTFGPLLLLTGIILVSPGPGDIPGVPAIMAVLVMVVAGQLLFRRDHFWLPKWLLKRSVKRKKLDKMIGWLRKPARFIDKLIKRRLAIFTRGAAEYVIALACVGIALILPFLEVIPFSANVAGAALTAFGLSLIAHDGLLALIAFAFTAGVIAIVTVHLI